MKRPIIVLTLVLAATVVLARTAVAQRGDPLLRELLYLNTQRAEVKATIAG